jgi:hypothetical protein
MSYTDAIEIAKKELLKRDYSDDEIISLVDENMSARSRHEIPDEWFWADTVCFDRNLLCKTRAVIDAS